MSEVDQSKTTEVFSSEYLDQISTNSMTPVFDKVLSCYNFSQMLDFGCGNGVFGIYFKEKGVERLYGIDGSDYALSKAKEAGYDTVIKVADFCSDSLPFANQTFDFVLCKDVLEHMLDPIHVLEEMVRVLKNNAYALIHVPNHFPLMYRFKFLFTNNIDTQNYFQGSNEWDFPHIRFFTHKGFCNMLENHGLSIIEDYSRYSPVFLPHTARIAGLKHIQKQLALKSPTNFANGFTVLARKVV